jgi:pimeloyl-ACP methyl ester carboxylesterase
MRRAVFWLVGLVVAALLLPLLALTFMRALSMLRETEVRLDRAPPSGQFVRADDVQMYLQQAGAPDGGAVVLVHGPGAWSEVWRSSIDALAQAGYRVVAPDLPPFGFSFRPASGDYSTEAQARRLLAALDALGIARASFVAHSTSARAVVEVAMQAPQRVQALVLVAPLLALTFMRALSMLRVASLVSSGPRVAVWCV